MRTFCFFPELMVDYGYSARMLFPPLLGCYLRVPFSEGYTVWVLRVLIFAINRAIRKYKFPQIKITANIFPAKIYSRVYILSFKFATQKYSTNKSCLFNYNLPLSLRNKTLYNELLAGFYIGYVYRSIVIRISIVGT